MMAAIIPAPGPKSSSELGTILPHEHVILDLRTWNTPGYAKADVDDVLRSIHLGHLREDKNTMACA